MLTKTYHVFLLGRKRLCIAFSEVVLCAIGGSGQVPSGECGALKREKPVFRGTAPTFIKIASILNDSKARASSPWAIFFRTGTYEFFGESMLHVMVMFPGGPGAGMPPRLTFFLSP